MSERNFEEIKKNIYKQTKFIEHQKDKEDIESSKLSNSYAYNLNQPKIQNNNKIIEQYNRK